MLKETFFKNLYKKKIDKEGMEEKNNYFYAKHINCFYFIFSIFLFV